MHEPWESVEDCSSPHNKHLVGKPAPFGQLDITSNIAHAVEALHSEVMQAA